MNSDITYEMLKREEIEEYSMLVNEVFDEFVGIDYSEEGNNTFKEFIETSKILERFNNEYMFFVAKYMKKIVGILEVKNKNHISLFFVKEEFQKKGIGKKLFHKYIVTLGQDINIITVNSSFYAVKIYSKLGFVKTGEAGEKNGIKYVPMEYRINVPAENMQ